MSIKFTFLLRALDIKQKGKLKKKKKKKKRDEKIGSNHHQIQVMTNFT